MRKSLLKLQLLRKKHGYTQIELGNRLSPPVCQTDISLFETGQKPIPIEYVGQLAKLFRCEDVEVLEEL